ncbi:MAG: carbohydrate ABC transporter permease [Chloroflexi bacterium]|nr:carbohydrate ABC transporter permease [Chloroflexota bacterium]
MTTQTTFQTLRSDRRTQELIWSIISYILLALFLSVFLFPVAWMVMTAFKPNAEIATNQAPLGIINPTLENFTFLFQETAFTTWMGNSLVVSMGTTIFSVIVGTLAAYALVRYRLRGSGVMGMSIFVTYLLPQTLLFIPMALVIQRLGLYDNLWGLVVVYPTIMVPFCTWLMMGYFRAIPNDMEEAARVDGASHWQAFYKIALPLATPGIISAAIFTFTMSWSEYLYALVLVPSTEAQTIPIGVPNALSSGDVYIWGSLMGAALLGSVPVVLIYALFMRFFVSGMTVGAVKG